MPDQTVGSSWTDPAWTTEAEAWITGALQHRGLRVTGPIEQPHLRPWSRVLRAPTDGGDVYFKAISPVLAHEVPVTALLARLRPDCTVPLLAVDVDRGWLLQTDGGVTLRQIIRADHDLRHWQALLPLYAELQIELADRLPELLALGVPDRRLQSLPGQYAQLLADTAALHLDEQSGLSTAEHHRLEELQPHVAALCRELAGYGIPESLNHGDFHDGNIFVDHGKVRFFDWGDGSISHPFFSLRTVFVSLEMSLGLDEGTEPAPVLDAYLGPWTGYAEHGRLQEAYALARQLAPICTALGWHRIVSTLEPALQAEYAVPVPALLQEFLSIHTAGA